MAHQGEIQIEGIYPTAPRLQTSTIQEFRLAEIRRLNDMLKTEAAKRKKLYKKYKKLNLMCVATNHGFTGAMTALSLIGIGFFTTAIGSPIALALEMTAAGGGVLSIVANLLADKFEKKAEKHERIGTLAASKVNSIDDLAQKALDDNHITEIEFQLIMKENEKFHDMKKLLRKDLEIDRAQIVMEEMKRYQLSKSK